MIQNMNPITKLVRQFQILQSYILFKLYSSTKLVLRYMKCSFCFFLQSNPFITHITYFVSFSFVGFLALKTLNSKNQTNGPKDLDLFFMSVSALTVSSMGTVEMENFTDAQLWVLTILMLIGGEVFTSMLGLQFTKVKISIEDSVKGTLKPNRSDIESNNLENSFDNQKVIKNLTCMVHIVVGYLIVLIFFGSVSILLYLTIVKQAGDVIGRKGIKYATFSVFTAVSSFGNCGFIPTNENMMIFGKNSILLLIIIPQTLVGNTLYPPLLRLSICVSNKLTGKEEYRNLLQNPNEVKYKHLFSYKECVDLSCTVLGLSLAQVVVFWGLEWNSNVLEGMNWFQKIVGSVFLSVNSRHTGESVVDLSSLSSAVLVLYVVMMYLPPYTSFIPINDKVDQESLEDGSKENNNKKRKWDNLIFSQLSYLAMFVISVCIAERRSMATDPLNFNIFNIIFEVISAYGNVGFSMGYSCKRQLKFDAKCKDASYGFVGKWSFKGKLILIIVMIFGRLKKFNMNGGKAWKLS
ncbi:hypothetical protein LUZ60_017263 [Juncus effusus]|nr:hypothetical protein LUZ60_017263 [Juncus effusus]